MHSDKYLTCYKSKHQTSQ